MLLTELGPLRLSPEDAAYEAPLRDALVRELYDRSTAALLGLVPVLLILKAVLGGAWDRAPGLKAVFAYLALVMAARLAFGFYVRRNPEGLSARRLAQAFLAGAALISTGWAAMNWIAWPFLDAGQIGLLVITHAGINAVALTSMGGPSFWSYLVYMGLDVASLLALTLWKGAIPEHNHLLILLLAIYLAILPFMAYQNHRALAHSMLSGLKLQDLVRQDSLTGLRNRRFLMEFLEPESERLLRSWAPESPSQQSLAILMLDLDHFKQVNDTHGHAAGDAVLKQLAEILGTTLRKQDLVIRWGGEEFVLVARGADRGYALMLADRIRARVEDHAFRLPDGKVLKKTCSIGFSVFPFSPLQPSLLRWEQVLSLADACLYRAKTQGRNRAIGAFPGDKAWEEEPTARLAEVERDLGGSAREGYVRLMGELR